VPTVPSEGFELRNRLTERLAEAGVVLDDVEVACLEAYYELLARWNRRMNLTALQLDGYPAPAIDRLLVEPILAARLVSEARGHWIDLGSGGGSPAVPLKILRPNLVLTLVESRERKAAFLREVVRTLRLSGVSVAAVRFETLAGVPGLAGHVNLVTTRAVRADAGLISTVLSLLEPGGDFLWLTTRDTAHDDLSMLDAVTSLDLTPTSAEARLFRKTA
jgi:16S rRNA (guanine527-N7)-methyltransferase